MTENEAREKGVLVRSWWCLAKGAASIACIITGLAVKNWWVFALGAVLHVSYWFDSSEYKIGRGK